jgi:hypothetical protein
MKKILWIFLPLLWIGCTKNMWTEYGVRPKKPKFSILKETFTDNRMIDHGFFYAYKKVLVAGEYNNYVYSLTNKDHYLYSFVGFYPDGKMIGVSLDEKDLPLLSNRNSWETAHNIGYYTTKGDKIKWQYFAPFDAGSYLTEEAIIKPDTLIIPQKYLVRLKVKRGYDTLIKSSYIIK